MEQSFLNLRILAGYVSSGKSRISCHSGVWSPSLDQVGCVEGVVLITGGGDQNLVEVYGPDKLRKSLANLPRKIREHSAVYIDGSVYLCGGHGNLNQCLKGEFQASSKGTVIYTVSPHMGCWAGSVIGAQWLISVNPCYELSHTSIWWTRIFKKLTLYSHIDEFSCWKMARWNLRKFNNQSRTVNIK